jgi:hypothetical protein
MPKLRLALVLLVAAGTALPARAADPVVVELQESCKVRRSVVLVGSVARLSGGEAALRDRIARTDLAELKPREQNLTITRRAVEYRLQLAGIDPAAVRVIGTDRTAVTPDRRSITADEVVAAAKTEAVHWLTVPRETVTINLARPVAVQLPEVPADEAIIITAVPHVKPVGLGRAQMNVVIATAEEKLLALGVDLDVKQVARGTEQVVPAAAVMTQPPPSGVTQPPPVPPPGPYPAAATTPAAPPGGAVIVQARQRVTMLVRSGGLNVTAVGEAQQPGRLGEMVQVQNIDSKKIVYARVSGPATVEIELDPRPQ